MRKVWLAIVLIGCFIFPVAVYAQDPTPPPSLLEICYSEGKFHSVECFKAVWDATGFGGVVILALILLFVYLFLTPSGEGFRDKVKDKSGEWWLAIFPWLRPALSSAEIQRREAECFEQEKHESLDGYLNALLSHPYPLKPSEDKLFVDLESGLSISLSAKSNQMKSFVEQERFNDLGEAINYVSQDNEYPYPAMALLGEPGAGKSTLLRKLARQITQERMDDPSKHLPIFVSLSAHKSGSPSTFLRQHWKSIFKFDGFDDALDQKRIWLFIDGLNEMPRGGYEDRVAAWRDFLSDHFRPNGNRALIACRVSDYGRGMEVPKLIVHEMDDECIQQFLKRSNPNHADALWNSLKKDRDEVEARDALGDNRNRKRGSIYDLAKIPFWLDKIALLSEKDGLPRNRADLLTRVINKWFDHERTRDGGLPISDIQRDAFENGLIQLAWVGLSRSQNDIFSEDEARKLLSHEQTALDAKQALKFAQDCSLLAEESKSWRFYHQLLQEYFAAHELKDRFLAGKNLGKLWKTPWRKWKFVQSKWDPLPPPPLTGWEEAVILAAGLLVDAEQVEKLTLAVLPHNVPLAARCILEAGMPIRETVTDKVKQRLQSDLQNPRVRLPARLSAGKMLAKLGDERLIKQRGEIELTDGRKANFIAPDWIEIPEGSFQMGTSLAQVLFLTAQRANPQQDELPYHKVLISTFKIARYPVTVAEYRCFMETGGYQNDAYWKEEISLRWRNALLPFEESYQYQNIHDLRENKEAYLKQVDILVKQGSWSPAQAEDFRNTINSEDDNLRKKWEDNENKKRDADGKIVQPWLWDNQQYTVDNQPVIGVSWYEACAYAAWLTEVLQKQGNILEQEEIRLPSESEWEKAARGTSGKLWTWGNLWNSSYANSLEGRVMQPSTVGAYPQNKSPYGIEDMIGNVWEWCLDWYNQNEYKERLGRKDVKDPRGPQSGSARVVRGGSWFDARDGSRCAYRDRDGPVRFDDDIGFRLVCFPSFKALHSDSLHSASLSK